MTIHCYICELEAVHFTECGGGALICDECVRAGKCCGNPHPANPGFSPSDVVIRMPLLSVSRA